MVLVRGGIPKRIYIYANWKQIRAKKSFKRDLPIERADCVCFMKFSMIGPDLSGAAEPIKNYFEILSGCEKR